MPFVALIVLSTIWVIEAIFELLSSELPINLLFADMQYVSIVFIPVVWLALALDYAGKHQWFTKRNLAAVSVVPLVMLGLQWTNSHHHLMRATARLETAGGHAVIGRTFGPVFWVHAV
jgi:hypothetical protein